MKENNDYCRWVIADDQYGHWRGDCGYEFLLEGELNPLAHGFFYCPSCGKHLTISEVCD